MKPSYLRIAFVIIATVHLAAHLADAGSILMVTKPLIVLCLLMYYLSATTFRSGMALVALVACWAGDVALMFVPFDEIWFMIGLALFLGGHVFYIGAYRQFRWESTGIDLLPVQKIRFSMPIVLAGTGLIVVLYPSLGGLRYPVIIYALTIMVMVMNALFRYGRTSSRSFWMVFAGAVLFMISDSTLAINKFLSPVDHAGFWIMLTYISAQYLIVEGLIDHQNRLRSA